MSADFAPKRIDPGRPTSSEARSPSISEALGQEHRRLARLEVEAFVARAAGDSQAASAYYEAFSSGLQRHITVEEQLLIPLFEARYGPGETDAMRKEHRDILRLLGEILRTIGDPAKLPDDARATFHELLEEHQREEERILYPALDHLLTAAGADAMVAEIQALAG